MNEKAAEPVDVIVIGGGAAGLSAAVTLGRSRRSVLVVDSGRPRNASADGVHSYLTRDGVPPAELVGLGRAEVEHYGGTVIVGEVAAVERAESGFRARLTDGSEIVARRVIVASGLTDRLPDIVGLTEQWGKGVLHCPYCHGWEVRDQPVGVILSGPMSVHQTLLLRQLTDDLVVFRHSSMLTDEDTEKLEARRIPVIDGVVAAVESVDGRLSGVRLADGAVVERAAVAVAPRSEARAAFLSGLGLHPVEHPSGTGTHIPADPRGATAVAGVWVAGNVGDLSAQVIGAAAQGTMAAAAVNADLADEDTREAVRQLRGGPA